ncbi:hypothetical protein HOE67_01140 [Candidatus Peregrinibacteria bacterium]|jgi:hypothetical protein|nr:hypothetical protein [Candidatus Peregrinibacteria bacterium]MBT4055691.1 hypothetical protein [Candidatus Peregrinibacteria bacterium]
MALEAAADEHIRRRSDNGGESIVYKSFSHKVVEAGEDLRVIEIATRISDKIHRRYQEAQVEDAFTSENPYQEFKELVLGEWRELATEKNGMREGDKDLDPARNDFAERVLEKSAELTAAMIKRQSMGIVVRLEECKMTTVKERPVVEIEDPAAPRVVPEGMPTTSEKAEATNKMVRLIEEELKEREKRITRTPKYIWQRIGQSVKGILMNIAMIERKEKEIPEEERLRPLSILPFTSSSISRFWSKYGGEKLLEKLKMEADAKDRGDIPAETLDNKFIKKIFDFFARDFMLGEDPYQAMTSPQAIEIENEESEMTFAPEIESTGDPSSAEQHYKEFDDTLEKISDPTGKRKFMSVKPSALCIAEYEGDFENLEKPPTITPERIEAIKNHLRKLTDKAIEKNVFIRIDMEQFFYKDVTYKIFTDLLHEDPVRANYLGIVMQTNQKESYEDAQEMIKFATKFHEETGKKVDIRLVKGAYATKDPMYAIKGLHKNLKTRWFGKEREDWHNQNRVNPAATNKQDTQRNHTLIMRMLEQHTDCLNIHHALHNPHHIAQIFQTWMNNGQIPSRRGLQSLAGPLGSPRKQVIRDIAKRREYGPFGRLSKTLHYLSRRFKDLKAQMKDGFYIPEYDEEQPGEVKVHTPDEYKKAA